MATSAGANDGREIEVKFKGAGLLNTANDLNILYHLSPHNSCPASKYIHPVSPVLTSQSFLTNASLLSPHPPLPFFFLLLNMGRSWQVFSWLCPALVFLAKRQGVSNTLDFWNFSSPILQGLHPPPPPPPPRHQNWRYQDTWSGAFKCKTTKQPGL